MVSCFRHPNSAWRTGLLRPALGATLIWTALVWAAASAAHEAPLLPKVTVGTLPRVADLMAPIPLVNQTTTTGPMATCHEAATAAEQAAGLPAGMLDAIGRVESGRYDPVSGQVWAWPWAVNAAGEGHSFNGLTEAINYVRDRQSAGVQSIDVGCFQINLQQHPDAFTSLEAAFDPATNAAYAARFLASLRQRTGGWSTAVAFYHSATPGLGEPYRDLVLARWSGQVPNLGPVNTGSWPAATPARARGDSVMISMSTGSVTALPAFGMHVLTPMAISFITPMAATAPELRLPKVSIGRPPGLGARGSESGPPPRVITVSR